MKIAYITTGNIFINSSANIRNIALIKGLEKIGNEVQIVCFENNKKRDAGFCEILKDSNVYCVGENSETSTTPIKANLNQVKSKKWKEKLTSRLKTLYRHIQVYDPYKHKLTEIDESVFRWDDYDICISSSDPKSSHLIVYKAKKAGHHFKWLQYWGDPMTLDLTIKTWVGSVIKREEKKLLTSADIVVFTNNLSKDEMKRRYPLLSNKFVSIPTSFFTLGSSGSLNHNKDYVSLGYFGGYAKINRNILPLMNVIKRRPDLRLIVAGGSDLDLSSNGSLTILDRLDTQTVHDLENSTDILVVLENLPKGNNPNEPCRQIPGKMYHYALLGKPILVVCETSAIKREFEKYDVYYFCMNNEQEIGEAINIILNDLSDRTYRPVSDFLPEGVATTLMSYIAQ
jgi:hypothetical protein